MAVAGWRDYPGIPEGPRHATDALCLGGGGTDVSGAGGVGGDARGAGVLLVAVQQEFGWASGSISLAFGINLLLYGLFGPFAVAVMDRWGFGGAWWCRWG